MTEQNSGFSNDSARLSERFGLRISMARQRQYEGSFSAQDVAAEIDQMVALTGIDNMTALQASEQCAPIGERIKALSAKYPYIYSVLELHSHWHGFLPISELVEQGGSLPIKDASGTFYGRVLQLVLADARDPFGCSLPPRLAIVSVTNAPTSTGYTPGILFTPMGSSLAEPLNPEFN